VGGDGRPVPQMPRTAPFRSTPPGGGRRRCAGTARQPQRFDPRPRVWGDCGSSSNVPLVSSFRSTPPGGGRREAKGLTQTQLAEFRSTPPGGGRRHPHAPSAPLVGVSIHAPGWGATIEIFCMIRTPLCFDPRPRVGGDIA